MRVVNDESGGLDIVDYGPYAVYGAFLKLDVNYSFGRCLDALEMFADVADGRSERRCFPGEVNEVVIEPSGVRVRHLFLEERRVEVPFGVARAALEEWAVMLFARPLSPGGVQVYRPDLSRVDAALHLWESTWRRRHPCRGRLGLPGDTAQ